VKGYIGANAVEGLYFSSRITVGIRNGVALVMNRRIIGFDRYFFHETAYLLSELNLHL